MKSEAELTLVIRARNLATTALKTVETAIDKVKTKAGQIAGAFRKAFAGLGTALGYGLSSLLYDLSHGSSTEEAFRQFGLTMGILAAETFILNMGGTIAEKVAGSTIIAKIGAQLAILGATMGGIVDTAMGIAMAALPFVLIAAIVAAIAVLIFNEDIRNQVFKFVGEVISNIGKFLGAVGKTLLEKIGAGIDWVAKNIGPFVLGLVKAIVDGLISLPGKIADVIRDAFTNLKIDIGPFHIRSTGVTIDLPDLNDPNATKHSGPKSEQHQGGGWVGLHGPQLSWVGEHGPEYVHPNHGLGNGGGSQTINLVVDGKVIAQAIVPAVSKQMYYELERAAPTASRV